MKIRAQTFNDRRCSSPARALSCQCCVFAKFKKGFFTNLRGELQQKFYRTAARMSEFLTPGEVPAGEGHNLCKNSSESAMILGNIYFAFLQNLRKDFSQTCGASFSRKFTEQPQECSNFYPQGGSQQGGGNLCKNSSESAVILGNCYFAFLQNRRKDFSQTCGASSSRTFTEQP